MAKTYALRFWASLNKDNMAKNSKGSFFKNIKNSPLFRKNMGEEQKKRSSKIFMKFFEK
jgi:hypothetical protein